MDSNHAFGRIVRVRRDVFGFTLVELMMGLGILIIISIAVAGDVTYMRKQEELNSGVRLIHTELRNLQSDALSAKSVSACDASGYRKTCTGSTVTCAQIGQPCTLDVSPPSFGITLAVGATGTTVFADIYDVADQTETPAFERLYAVKLSASQSGNYPVLISSILADGVSVSAARITFDRQSGAMHLHGCSSGVCPANVMTVTLRHAQTNKTKTLRCDSVTGRIDIQ